MNPFSFRKLTFLSVLILAFAGISCAGPQHDRPSPLLLISIDGMMTSYLDRTETPNLDRIIAGGVLAGGMIPVFPTKTFPNHYSLVTGLYTENTGLISNNMYDPVMDASFSLGNREAVSDGRWYGGEPIWVTAETQGMRTATMFWPGSEAEIGGVRPTRWMEYDGSIPYMARVDSVINWLQLEDDSRPEFLTLYFSQVDSRGHQYGPDSEEVLAAVAMVDGVLGYLLDELDRIGMAGSINILITSDHGMAAISEERVIILDDIIDLDDVRVVDWTPVAMLQPAEGKKEEIYQKLKAAEANYTVYRKEDVPDVFRFRNHYRVPEIIVMADMGYTITSRSFLERRGVRGGAHGYDHREPGMRAFFLAHGPGIRDGLLIEPFSSVHVYELMCRLLGLEPAPNDGDPAALIHILN
jgi:predicted AlkP superfamily pyrophosphatase or phosphodiesterase